MLHIQNEAIKNPSVNHETRGYKGTKNVKGMKAAWSPQAPPTVLKISKNQDIS